MQQDLFFSHAATEVELARALADWLRSHSLNVYLPETGAVKQGQLCLVLLSVRWLRSEDCTRQLLEAQQAGRAMCVLVHPDIAHDATDSTSRGRRAELELTLSGHACEAVLRPLPWFWACERLGEELALAPLVQMLQGQADWAACHARLAERSLRWRQQGDDPSLLMRGSELMRDLGDVLRPEPGRLPALNRDQLMFLIASQKAEMADSQRLAALCWGAQAQAAGMSAQQYVGTQPDLALALAAASADVADTPQARRGLLTALGHHPGLRRIFHHHTPGRPVKAMAFSPDGQWLATADTRADLGDTRPARLNLIHLESLSVRDTTQTRSGLISALAWGRPWLALASRGSISWLRWDEAEQRFGARSPRQLAEPLAPQWLAWSGPTGPGGEDWLAWGCAEGLVGLTRPGETRRQPDVRLRHVGRPDALQGLAWLGGDKLLTIERNELLVRPLPTLEPATTLGKVDQVFELWSQSGHWVLSCVQRGRAGVMHGYGAQVKGFEPVPVKGPFEAADMSLEVSEPQWLVSARPPHDMGAPGLAWGARLNGLHTLQAPEAGKPAGLAVDCLRRRVATGDIANGQVWLWEPNAPHVLLRSSLPAGIVSQLVRGSDDSVLWMDAQGDIHSGIADTDKQSDRLSAAGFKALRMLGMNYASHLLLLGPRGESLALDRADQMRYPVRWPQPLQRDTVGLVACADQAQRTATVDGAGNLRVLEGPPQTWGIVAEWLVPGQTLSVTLSPSGEHVYAMVAQGFIRVARWIVGGSSSPEWVAVLRNGKPGPMVVDANGALLVADGPDLYRVPAPGDTDPPVLLSGHAAPILRLAALPGLLLSVAGRDQHARQEELRLWSPNGQPLGMMVLPDKLADLVVSRDGRYAWLLTLSGALWRLPLRVEHWARIARNLAGRELSPAERRTHGLADVLHRMPTGEELKVQDDLLGDD